MSAVAENRLAEGGVLTIPEVREFLKLSEVTVYKLLDINGGPIKSTKLGKSRRVFRKSVLDFLEAQEGAS